MEGLCSQSCAAPSTGAVTQYMSLLLNVLSVSQCSLSPPEMWPEDYAETALRRGFPRYDFIVVGAGSAGSVVASRLSENPMWKVLLVEAGGDPPIESAVPGLVTTFPNTSYDWSYHAERSNRYNLNAGLIPRGKMLGGSGSLNTMYYVRGNENDYNTWEALGNPTWGWDDVIPYFKRSENNKDFGGEYHSKDGPIDVQLFRSNETSDFFIVEAAKELGYKYIPDMDSSGESIGFTMPQGTIGVGMRSSSATGYLSPARIRSNLHVVKNTHVLNVIIKNGRAVGVRMNIRGEKILKAFARREVIVSAGVFGTPQLLMLSGIGPAHHLWEMRIPVIRNLAVGKNFQDHYGFIMGIKLNKSVAVPPKDTDLLKAYFSYMLDRTGPLASNTYTQAFEYVNVDDFNATYPNFQLFHLEVKKGETAVVEQVLPVLGYNSDFAKEIASVAQNSSLLLTLFVLLKEKSRGEILLKSRDPFQYPLIDFNFLAEESDVVSVRNAIRFYQKYLTTETFKKLNAELMHIPLPTCDFLVKDSDDYWDCYARYTSTAVLHPVGTAKMGPRSDPDAVVDYRLRVRGIKGLRVIDASIMPISPSGNTNAPTVMIAEKGSDFIKEDWGYFDQQVQQQVVFDFP